MLAGTHGEGNEPGDSQCLNRDRGHIFQRWKIIKFKIFVHLHQEHFYMGLDLSSLENHTGLWIGVLRA